MIKLTCVCGAECDLTESQTNQSVSCVCGRTLTPVCAESLPAGAGAADFDARLTIRNPNGQTGTRQLYLGGVEPIDAGRQDSAQVCLIGTQVSRRHCTFERLDFGPSRWKVVDHHSANGLYLNGRKIDQAELCHGDRLRIGDFELLYELADGAPKSKSAATLSPRAGGSPCPSCGQSLAPGAKICVNCGINVQTGRPILVSKGMDENFLYARAETIIRWVSWIVSVTPMPIPLASEGFGTKKPYAIWGVTAFTILASLLFFFATWGGRHSSLNTLMLWPIHSQPRVALVIPPQKMERLKHLMSESERQKFEQARNELRNHTPADQLDNQAVAQMIGLRRPESFHWYQLLTCAFLHNNGSIFGFILHLGGNMLFLLVFGTRVNAVLGNIATLILYPLLAVASAAFYMVMTPIGPAIPMLGASGAIMGLAGMYLVLFPLHRVYCAMWIRWGLFVGFRISMKIFTLRGFWILLMYFGFDLLIGLLTRHHVGGGTAHWAHVGGFCAGLLAALAILLSRRVNTYGGDLLSVLLGRHAWALIGKPSRWQKPAL